MYKQDNRTLFDDLEFDLAQSAYMTFLDRFSKNSNVIRVLLAFKATLAVKAVWEKIIKDSENFL